MTSCTPRHLQLRRARFAELTGREVYGLCRLRVDVFVVEQRCPYPELDGRDLEPTTVHLWFAADDVPVATIRVLREETGWAIGRVATAAGWRGRGPAARLMAGRPAPCRGEAVGRRGPGAARLLAAALAVGGDEPVVLGAQAYLEGWYERFGFRRTGPDYVEDG